MSGTSGRHSQTSNGNGTPAAKSGRSVTSPIRDFLYLNQDRIFSYLSQMDGGLKLLYTKVREDGWSEEITSPEKTTEVGIDLSASVEGKLAALAGMTGEFGGDWKHSVTTGGDSRTDHERRATADLFGLHHRAFDLVMDRIGGRFTTVHGKIFLLDFEWTQENIKDFPEIIKASNKFVDASSKTSTPQNTTPMSYLLRTYMNGKVLVILRTEDGRKYTAYLEKKHLLSSLGDITDAFGQTPTLEFTLVGILAPPQKFEDAGDFSVPHFLTEAKELSDQLAIFAGSLSNMRDFFNVKSTVGHLVPLALYLEI